MKQDFEKTRRTQYTFSDDGLKKSPVANFVEIDTYIFFPPYILLLFIPALVKHTRVWSNWVNGFIQNRTRTSLKSRAYYTCNTRIFLAHQ